MVLLENDQFLSEMTKMYQRNREKGSVWTTMKSSLCLNRPQRRKRATEKDDDEEGEEEEDKKGDDDEGNDNPARCCLVRCTDGKRKISTRVYANKAEKFAAAFTLVQKASMDGLKEKEKKKKTKKKKTTNIKTTTPEEKKDAMDASAPEKKKKRKKKTKKSGRGGGDAK